MRALTLKKIVAAVASAMVCVAAAAQSVIKVDAPNIVGDDEQFNVTFIIEGEGRPSDFNWSSGGDFSLVWGPQKGESTSISIINGKRTKSSQFTYTYILKPVKTGKFVLPQATAKVGGEMISSSPVSVEVLSGGNASAGSSRQQSSEDGNRTATSSGGNISSSDLFLKLSLSRTDVVIGEPITAELKLYQRVDIAGFEGAKFPSFNGFWSQETASPANIEFVREDVGGQLYNAALLRRYVLIPQQAGKLVIDPAELVCLVNVRTASKRGSSIFDSFFDDGYTTVKKRISTPQVQVQVKPLPAGAPDDFCGGVGNFRVSAKLSKGVLKTHEATSLTVTVTGRGNVSLVEAPEINFPPDMEVYDTKTVENTDRGTGGTSGSKTFEYPFIPRSSGHFSIGPVKFSYYDVSSGKYVTADAGTVEFDVEKGETADGAPAYSQIQTPDRKGVKNLGSDIRYIYTAKPSWSFRTSFFIGSWPYWLAVLLIFASASAAWCLLRGMEHRRADVAGNRNRRATRMALGRLKVAGEYLEKKLYSAFYEELHKALLGFVSDKMNIGAEDLNKDNIAVMLSGRGIPDELAGRFVALLDACEFARYSPDGGNEAMTAHYNEAVDVISSIDSQMKGKKINAASRTAALAVALMLTLPGVSRANDDVYLDSLWQKGVASYSKSDWNGSLEHWKSLESTGVVSPELYYNMANAYFKSGDYAHAVLYYERTLKSDPSFSDARYNLEFTEGMIQDKIDSVPEFVLKSWARKICYMLSSGTWAAASLVLLAAALAMLLLFLLGGTPLWKRTGFYSAIFLFVMSVAGSGFSAWQKNSYMKADYAVVMSPVASVKSSPSSESSKDLFVLHEGTKVKILDTVGSWRNISLSDGRQGWIRENDMEII